MGIAGSIRDAITAAYEGVGDVHFDGMQYRKDIAQKALKRIEAAT
jgi:phosphoribosylamine--glycine ligase